MPPRLLRRVFVALPATLASALVLVPATPSLAAEPPDPAPVEAAVPDDFPRLVLDSGRPEVSPPEPDLLRLQLHGEYQVRYQHVRPFPLDVTPSTVNAKPGAIEDSTGQRDFLAHWLRLTPRFQFRRRLQIVGQIDVVTGLLLGRRAHETWADETPRDTYDGASNVQPRWLFLELETDSGVFRGGQQPSHWGMGLLANDGDHPTLFGDYRYGNIVERLLFAGKPGGARSPWTVMLAGDVVFRDQFARLTRDERALQGVLAVTYGEGPNTIGLYGVYRDQTGRAAGRAPSSDDRTQVGFFDVTARFAAPVPGDADAFVFGQAEGVVNAGRNVVTPGGGRGSERTRIASYGGAASLGVAHRARGSAGPLSGSRDPVAFGDVVAQVELGYASGDADPYDGTDRRFVFHPNHRVGLLLFDEVMRFQTARAAVAAQDPLYAGARPVPGVSRLPSDGGIFGAQYIYPTFVLRPRHWLDLKAGALLAQATADVVDPYRTAVQGSYVNYRGGDARRRDLGVEIDLGTEARIPLDDARSRPRVHGREAPRMMLTVGAQGGVLFAGGALANVGGQTMKLPWLTIGRVGFLF